MGGIQRREACKRALETCQALCARRWQGSSLPRGVQRGTECGPHVQRPTWGLHGPGEKAAILQCPWRFWKALKGQQRSSWGCGEAEMILSQEKTEHSLQIPPSPHPPESRLFSPVGMFHFSGYFRNYLSFGPKTKKVWTCFQDY